MISYFYSSLNWTLNANKWEITRRLFPATLQHLPNAINAGNAINLVRLQNANPLVERSLRLNSCIGSMQWKEGNRKSHAFHSEFSFHSITSGNNISKNCPAFDYSLSSTVQHAANISNRRNGVTKALGKLPNRLLTGTEETFLSKQMDPVYTEPD